MVAPSLQRKRRTLLGIPQLVAAMVLLSVFAMATRVPTSPDTWWHLRCGEVQWRTRAVIRSDLFSHTAAGAPWVNQSWLPQLAMFGLYTLGGFQALALSVAAVVTAAMGVTMAAVRRACRPDPLGRYGLFWRAFVVLWAAISTGRVWVARPQLATLLLTALWVYLLDRRRRDGMGALWALPPLMLLWANSHGGYIVGFVLLGAEVGGLVLEGLARQKFDGLWPRIRPLLACAALCVAAAWVNPQGVRLLLFPFNTLGSTAQQGYIAEWASPNFHAADLLPFLALLVAAWAALALGRTPVARGESGSPGGVTYVRLAGFTVMALRSGRYLGLCAIVAAPILARWGGWALRRLADNWRLRIPGSAPARGIPALNAILLVLMVAAGAAKIALPLLPATIEQVHAQILPVGAVAYLRAHDLPPTLFNDYAWGGYLIWTLYPDTPVFIDGRADPYGDRLIEDYRRTVMALSGWEEVLAAHDVRTALVGIESALAEVMRAGGSWQEVYTDPVAAILVRAE